MKQSRSSITKSINTNNGLTKQLQSEDSMLNSRKLSSLVDKSPKQKSSIDIKKINISKNPAQSQSSLELLILLLSRSLKMSLEEILGLFTNQNKYLAHIIVKGVNDQFSGIQSFYQQLLKYVETLHGFLQQDKDDFYACLYAIKTGFISKDEIVSSLTIQLFQSFTNQIYEWFINQQAKCSNTLLLGFRRHSNLNLKLSELLFNIIKGNQVNFFEQYYVKSFISEKQFLTITTKLVQFMSTRKSYGPKEITQSKDDQQGQSQAESLLIYTLEKQGIFEKWFQIAQQLFEKDLDDKILVIQFIGQIMQWMPLIMQKNQIILNSIRRNWLSYPLNVFIPLFNQLLISLQRLALKKSSMSRKLYNIIIDIFNDVYKNGDKKDFIVNSFITILSEFPTMPSDMFINNYQKQNISSSDFVLICQAIDISNDVNSLIKIGDTLKEMFFFNPIINYCLYGLIVQVVKKVIKFQSRDTLEFLQNLIKVTLANYVTNLVKAKALNKPTAQVESIKKSKVSLGNNDLVFTNKFAEITINLAQKIVDILLFENISSGYINVLKSYFLTTNSQIKKNFFGSVNKKIISILNKKFGISSQQQSMFQQEKLSNSVLNQSSVTKKSRQKPSILSLSRAQVPQSITKQFSQIIQKRKKQQLFKQQQQIKRKKDEEFKKIMYKKELQKMNLIRGGFGDGQAQLKEQGFWSKFVKEQQDLQIFTHDFIEDVYIDAAELILKKYNKLFKYLFFNYSSTMYSTKAVNNFDQNLQRKQTLTSVEVIKLLKDYKLIFSTNATQIQSLIRQINVKIFHRKQIVNELDFDTFEQFIKQYCLCIWSRNQNYQGKNIKTQHLCLPQLMNNFIEYLQQVFKSKNQNVTFFQINQQQQQCYSDDIIELNHKLIDNPNMILPQGYKKVTDKKFIFSPKIKQIFTIPQDYKVCIQILDQILFSKFDTHFVEPESQKIIKTQAKPMHQINVRQKNPNKIKARALSTLIDRKTSTHSIVGKVTNRNQLSKQLKKALLLLKISDKIIGEQVAFTMQQMLIKIEDDDNNDNKLNRISSLHKIGLIKPKAMSQRRVQSVLGIKVELPIAKPQKNYQKIKQQLRDIKQKKLTQAQQKHEQYLLKQKKRKQMEQKYYQQLKQKLSQKKKIEEQQKQKQKEELLLKKLQKKKNKQKFQQFNSKRINDFSRQFSDIALKKKKEIQNQQQKYQDQQEKRRILKQKIDNSNKIITDIRKQTAQKITQLVHGQEFSAIARQYQTCLKAVFEFLQKQSFKPLADKKCKPGEIDYDTWVYFNNVFDISPLIINSKDLVNIFKGVTRQKNVSKQFLMGLSYDQFLQALLRQCIKQKTIFQKITQRIINQTPEIVSITNKKNSKALIKVQIKNQFQEEEEIDVKKLLKQQDIKDDIQDHYGDITKFNVQTFKGIIYYLKVPFVKKNQQLRFRQLLQDVKKQQSKGSNIQRLKEKLKAEYTLERLPVKDKKPQIKSKPIQKPPAEIKKKK